MIICYNGVFVNFCNYRSSGGITVEPVEKSFAVSVVQKSFLCPTLRIKRPGCVNLADAFLKGEL